MWSRRRNTPFTSGPYCGSVATFLLRVLLPDRPGALGAVASRIGAVRGDVIAVEIVERGNGHAIDEFIVDLPDADLVPLLVSEVGEVDGASVEEIHPVTRGERDSRFEAYDNAGAIVAQRSPHAVLHMLALRARLEFDASWAAVIGVEEPLALSVEGRPPAVSWLAAFITDTKRQQRTHPAEDIAWVDLAAWDLVLIMGRPGWRFSDAEHKRLGALARLADARWVSLTEHQARGSHPSRAG